MKLNTLTSSSAFRALAWILILLGLIALLGYANHTGKMVVQTDLLAMLPESDQDPVQEKAFERVSAQAGKKILVFVGNKDLDQAKEAAKLFYQKISELAALQDIKFMIEEKDQDNFVSYYFPYRYHLLSSEYRSLLEEKRGELIRKKAVRAVYSPVGIAFPSQLTQDPFLLFNNYLFSLPLFNTGLFPDGNMLTVKNGGISYVFMSATLATSTTDPAASLARTMQAIYQAKKAVEGQFKDAKLVFSGIPFHSYAGAQSSKKEISLIANISLLGIVLLIFFTFRSSKPLWFSLLSIGFGFLAALAVSFMVFGKLHILTIVFGTTLIGVSIDYAFHFFTEFFNYKEPGDGGSILKRIFSGITLGLITSLMGYLALIIAPFPGLQQIALFSTVGLLGAYLTVLLLFPIVKSNIKEESRIKLMQLSDKLLAFWKTIKLSKKNIVLGLIALLVIAVGISRLKTNDDIRLLYSSPRALLKNEILASKLLKNNTASQFFLVQGDTQQKMLEKEEQVMVSLNELIAEQKIASYQSLAQIVPSTKRQRSNYNLLQKYLFKPYLSEQLEFLGLGEAAAAKLKRGVTQSKYTTLGFKKWIGAPQAEPFKHLWLGEIEGKSSSIILLGNIKDVPALAEIAEQDPNVSFVNKVGNISNTFKKYRHTSSGLVAAVYVLILFLLCFRYGYKKAFLILLPPVLASLITIAILGYLNFQFNLFNILALILVLGIGIDYTLFFVEGEAHQKTTSLAILLSAITTILSFGLLSLSSTPLINSFGITILIGIFFAYLLSPIATLSKKPEVEPSA